MKCPKCGSEMEYIENMESEDTLDCINKDCGYWESAVRGYEFEKARAEKAEAELKASKKELEHYKKTNTLKLKYNDFGLDFMMSDLAIKKLPNYIGNAWFEDQVENMLLKLAKYIRQKQTGERKTYEQGKEEGRKEMLDDFKLTDEMKHKIAEQVKFMQERAEKTGDRDIWDMLELFTIIENAIKSARY